MAADAPLLIVVRRAWFEELASGAKRVEYRRYGKRFNERVLFPGRRVSFAYRYDRVSPRLAGVVTSFAAVPLFELLPEVPDLLELWPGIGIGDARDRRQNRLLRKCLQLPVARIIRVMQSRRRAAPVRPAP